MVFLYDLQLYCNEAPDGCTTQDLKAILDPNEAKGVSLDLRSYWHVVELIMSNSDGAKRMTVLASRKDDGVPVGIATFLEVGFPRSSKSSPLDEASRTQFSELFKERRVTYELQYCLRRKNARGMCVGDAMLSCGIEAIANLTLKRPAEKVIWLLLAGSFSNNSALNLYSKFKFRLVGMLEQKTPIMTLTNVESCVNSARETMRRSMESRYLLPMLKRSRLLSGDELNADEGDVGQAPMSQESQASTAPSEQNVHSVVDESQHSSLGASQVSSQASSEGDDQQSSPGVESAMDVREQEPWRLLEGFKFRTYLDHLKWASNVVMSVSGNRDQMLANLTEMAKQTSQVRREFSFMQHVEMVRQIDRIALAHEENPLNIKREIARRLHGVGEETYSEKYVGKMIQFSWCLYRYPVFEQLIMNWRQGKVDFPF